MRVWPTSESTRLNIAPLPPMYAWPILVKRVILLLATSVCLGAYLLLIASILGVSLLWFN